MLFKKAACVALCAAALAGQPGSAAEEPPLPSPRPVPMAKDASGKPEPERSPAEGENARALPAKDVLRALVKKEAGKTGLPPEIADAVPAIESGYDPSAVGAVGEVGLMQVRPETAMMLGFKGDLSELANPETNIRYGVAYLSQAWRLAGGDLCRTLMKYRAGHGEEIMSPLSAEYCSRARAHLAAAGTPYAAAAFSPFVFVFSAPGPRVALVRRGPPKNRTAAVSRAFWAAHEARVRAITQQIEARWQRMASR